MPATSTFSPTGNSLIDGVLMGTKWAVNSFTFSFPTSASYYGSGYGNGEPNSNFQAFSSQQQAWVSSVLDNYADVANLTFTEVTETASKHGDFRYAMSDLPYTAWAYYPTTNAAGGDAWFNNSSTWYDNPLKGNYAAASMLHETGHALGLKHPHEVAGSFGALPTAYDSLEYSVMSYRSYVGASTSTGYTNASDSYPQTLMMLDIAAVQQLYGADFTTHNEDTTYSWNPTTGRASINGVADASALAGTKIFMTLWDGGGNDTYDFSNYSTNLKVDLQPGHWTTVNTGQLAYLGYGHYAAGNIANALLYNNNPASLIENAIGGSGNDVLIGNAADNRLTGGLGNDSLDGLGGTNTAVYAGASSQYVWSENSDGTWTVSGLEGTDTLANIQYLEFRGGTGVETVALGATTPPDPLVADSTPVAEDDSYAGAKNKKLTVKAKAGVLVNDSDPDGGALHATLVSGPSSGKLSFKADGSFTYTPVRKYTGTVTFTYQATDGNDTSNVATVTITVGSSSAAKARGHGADRVVDLSDDQMPLALDLLSGAAGHNGTAGDSSHAVGSGTDVDPLQLWMAHAVATGETGSHLLGQIDAVLAALGAEHNALPMGDLGGGDGTDIGLLGLPDFAHQFYAEFALA